MLKLVTGMIVAAFLVGNAWSKCSNEKVVYFKMNHLLNDEITVNIPLMIDGKQACYHGTSPLSIVAENINYNSVDYAITPLEAEFENIPDPKIYQYVFFDKESENESDSTKIHMISYLCSNETPIGADALSDSLKRLAETSEAKKEEGGIFISTGKPSEGISVSPTIKAKAKVYDKFLEIYEERTGIDVIEDLNSNIYVPNVGNGFSEDSVHKKIYLNFFTRTGSSLNGCSKKFLSAMQDLLIENVAKNRPFKGIDLKRKYFTNAWWLNWTP